MQYFVEDLLNLQSIEHNTFNLDYKPFDVFKAAREVCKIFQPQTKGKNIEVLFCVDHSICMQDPSAYNAGLSSGKILIDTGAKNEADPPR